MTLLTMSDPQTSDMRHMMSALPLVSASPSKL